MRKLSQLDKNISRIEEMTTMFNRKRISLCKLEHERADHGKYFFGLSLPDQKKSKEKEGNRRGTGASFDTSVQAMNPVSSRKRIKRASKPYDRKTIMYGYERGALKARRKPRIGPTRVRTPTLLLLE